MEFAILNYGTFKKQNHYSVQRMDVNARTDGRTESK